MTAVDIHRRGDAVDPADYAKAAAGLGSLLDLIDDAPARDGLADTPTRVIGALIEMTGGRHVDVDALLAVSFDPGHPANEMVLLRDIDFVSVCEHHLMPFIGVAHVAYIPAGGRVLGLSKLARVVDAYARRLQVQERMTRQVVDALTTITPDAACVVRATHACMTCRGIRRPGATMVTSALAGAFHDDSATRAEFMSLTAR